MYNLVKVSGPLFAMQLTLSFDSLSVIGYPGLLYVAGTKALQAGLWNEVTQYNYILGSIDCHLEGKSSRVWF